MESVLSGQELCFEIQLGPNFLPFLTISTMESPALCDSVNDPLLDPDEPQWRRVCEQCLRRVQRWRVPPHWGARDWQDELRAEAESAAWQAAKTYNPHRGVPLWAFVRKRVLFHLLRCYRTEWSYSRHHGSDLSEDEIPDPGPTETNPTALDLSEILARLNAEDRTLIRGLFWQGKSEAEIAITLRLSQQAVSKRKITILLRLRCQLQDAPSLLPSAEIYAPASA